MKNIKSILAVTVLSILLFSCNSDDSENIGQISNDPIEEITVENATHYKITWDTLNDKIRINELNDIPVENPVWIVNECMETLGGNGFVNFRFFADINDYFEYQYAITVISEELLTVSSILDILGLMLLNGHIMEWQHTLLNT